MIDYHNHTKLCKHAEGEVFQYIEKALSKGITEIAFTDHMPLPNQFDIAHRMDIKEFDRYYSWVKEAQSQYPEIKILFGIEADYYEGFEKYIESFLKDNDFDLVIMSIHFLKNWPEGNWVFNYNFPERNIEDIYTEYLEEIIKGLKTGLFDIIGHLDIAKKPGISMTKKVPHVLSNVMQAIKNQEMVIEINTSGYRKKIQEPYPSFDMLNIINKYNIPLCIGSDAHTPEQVAFNFKNVYKTLIKNGIENVILFEKRKKIVKPIKELITI